MAESKKRTKEPLDESEKAGFKLSKNKDHGIRSHHFTANRWGNTDRLLLRSRLEVTWWKWMLGNNRREPSLWISLEKRQSVFPFLIPGGHDRLFHFTRVHCWGQTDAEKSAPKLLKCKTNSDLVSQAVKTMGPFLCWLWCPGEHSDCGHEIKGHLEEKLWQTWAAF